jgi:hypothetical protein
MERAFEVVTAGGSSDDRKPDLTPGHHLRPPDFELAQTIDESQAHNHQNKANGKLKPAHPTRVRRQRSSIRPDRHPHDGMPGTDAYNWKGAKHETENIDSPAEHDPERDGGRCPCKR